MQRHVRGRLRRRLGSCGHSAPPWPDRPPLGEHWQVSMSSAQISGIKCASFTSMSMSSSPHRTFTVLCFGMPFPAGGQPLGTRRPRCLTSPVPTPPASPPQQPLAADPPHRPVAHRLQLLVQGLPLAVAHGLKGQPPSGPSNGLDLFEQGDFLPGAGQDVAAARPSAVAQLPAWLFPGA